jgi:hypothetical protein
VETPENVLHTLNTFRIEARWIYEHLYAGREKSGVHQNGACEQGTIEECYKHLEEYHYGKNELEEISRGGRGRHRANRGSSSTQGEDVKQSRMAT